MSRNSDADGGVSINQQVSESREAIENAIEALDREELEDEAVISELDIAATLLGAAAIRTDPRLVALRELFTRDKYDVESIAGPLGDYKIRVDEGGCLHENKTKALRSLGFDLGSVHQHTGGDDEPSYMSVYVNDGRGDAR